MASPYSPYQTRSVTRGDIPGVLPKIVSTRSSSQALPASSAAAQMGFLRFTPLTLANCDVGTQPIIDDEIAEIIACCFEHEEKGNYLEPYFTPLEWRKYETKLHDFVRVELGLELSREEINQRREPLIEPVCGCKVHSFPIETLSNLL